MYGGQNVQYGWGPGSPRASDVIELPLAPVRRQQRSGIIITSKIITILVN